MANSHISRFRIVRLKREELIDQCKADDFEVWGEPDMTLRDYQADEKQQRQTAHSQRGLIVWALVERTPTDSSAEFGSTNDMDDSDITPGHTTIVCHCESHTFDCMLRKMNGAIVRGLSYHINAVYTLPSFRRQGLAKFFLKEVTRQLAAQDNAVASVLYSEIGPDFYHRLGWHAHPSTAAMISVPDCQDPAWENDLHITPLFLNASLDKILANEHSRIEARLQREQQPASDREIFVALPTRDCLEWQFCSGVFHASVRKHAILPTQCGVRGNDSSFVLWTHDFRSSTLFVTYMSLQDDHAETILCLLREAVAEARRFGLQSVEIWDPPAVLKSSQVAKLIRVIDQERTDSISSLMLFKHVRDDPNTDSVPTWLHNERFAWV